MGTLKNVCIQKAESISLNTLGWLESDKTGVGDAVSKLKPQHTAGRLVRGAAASEHRLVV